VSPGKAGNWRNARKWHGAKLESGSAIYNIAAGSPYQPPPPLQPPLLVTNRKRFGEISLSAEGIAHRFGRHLLFREVTVDWVGGTSIAIVGANGSGKSTLVRILAGLLTPWRGTVDMSFGGRKVSKEQRPFQVGMVAPYLQVYDGFSLRENLEFLFRARGMPGDVHAAANEMIERVGLQDRGDDPVGTFSSGMKQRARLAAALLSSPPMLLFDEPGTNLDETGRRLVREIGDRHLDEGGLLIVATNDSEEAAWCSLRLQIEDYQRKA
jgi:heme exporter protein A